MSVHVAQGTDDEVRKPQRGGRSPFSLDTETVRLYISSVLSRMRNRITMDTLRPLPMFLGLSGHAFCLSVDAFNPPARHIDKSLVEKIRGRLTLNFAFFLTNYALVALGVALVVALGRPGMLVVVGVVWGLWSFHSFLIQNELIVFGHNVSTMLSIRQRSAALTILTLAAVVWKCLLPVMSFFAISGVIICSHACLRDPKHIDSYSSDFSGSADSDDEEEVLVERGDVI